MEALLGIHSQMLFLKRQDVEGVRIVDAFNLRQPSHEEVPEIPVGSEGRSYQEIKPTGQCHHESHFLEFSKLLLNAFYVSKIRVYAYQDLGREP